MKKFIPTLHFDSIWSIDFEKLKSMGVLGIILDVDNTLVPTSVKEPNSYVKDWLEQVKEHGLKACLVSNNSRVRVAQFNQSLGLPFFHRSMKPMKRNFLKAVQAMGLKNEQVCVIGDQIFSDIWGANRAGLRSVLVDPLSHDEGIGVKLKRIIERPFTKSLEPTYTFYLIGDPVGHSLSPRLHQTVYDYYNINARYLLKQVSKDDIGGFVDFCKSTNVCGFNVTVPHKQNIIPHLDWISPDAQAIGAVNTVAIVNGKLYGYNTDWSGFLRQMERDGVEPKGKRVKILGAGGSTMAIAYAMEMAGSDKVTIYNRTVQKAQSIAQKLNRTDAMPLSEFFADNCDILINTTSVGLHPMSDAAPVENLDGLSQAASVFDIIYNPPETKLMQMAKAKGVSVHNGLKMLMYQGLNADDIWFKRQTGGDELESLILKEIGDSHN